MNVGPSIARPLRIEIKDKIIYNTNIGDKKIWKI